MKILLICATLMHIVASCKVSYHRDWPMEERLEKSHIVVYGKDVSHFDLTGVKTDVYPLPNRTDMVFEVYCVLKHDGGDPIPGNITVEQIAVRSTCSGTQGKVNVGSEYIMGLKRRGENFEWDEQNEWQTFAFEASEKNLQATANLCVMKNSTQPVGSVKGCPVPLADQECTTSPPVTTQPASGASVFGLSSTITMLGIITGVSVWHS